VFIMPYIEIGKERTDVWPPDDAETNKRLDNYKRCRHLFKGQHAEVFERVQKWLEESGDKWMVYVACNFAGLISKVSADMLFGEKVKYVVDEDPVSDEQGQLNQLIESNKLNTVNYEMALSTSWRGEVIYKVRFGKLATAGEDEQSHAIIEPASPGRFFPITSGDNIRDLQGGVFGYVRKAPPGVRAREGRDYLRIERHLPGKIQNELWLLEEDGRTIQEQVNLNLFEEYAELEQEQETKYPGLLFTFTPNWRLEDEFWGISDYYDLETIFDEINNRVSRISRVLDKHESPRLILPPGIMHFDEKTERWYVTKEDLEMMEVSGEDETVRGDLPKYLTWDAQLDAAFKQIDKLMQLAFLISETSPDAFGLREGGAAESGRALKFRLIRLLAKINRKKLYFDQALKDVIGKALHMEAEHGGGLDYSDTDLRIEWGDGIPADPKEQAEIEGIRTGHEPTTSVRSAVRRLDDLEGEDLENEMQGIEADRAGQGEVTPPEGARTGLDLGLGEEEERGGGEGETS